MLFRSAEQIGDVQRDVLSCGYAGGKKSHVLVEEGVIKGFDHQVVHQLLQGRQITDHARAGINGAAHVKFENQIRVTLRSPPHKKDIRSRQSARSLFSPRMLVRLFICFVLLAMKAGGPSDLSVFPAQAAFVFFDLLR